MANYVKQPDIRGGFDIGTYALHCSNCGVLVQTYCLREPAGAAAENFHRQTGDCALVDSHPVEPEVCIACLSGGW